MMELESNNRSSQVTMEDEAFPSEEVSQSLANSHSLTNRPSHSSRNSSDTNPRCSILTLLVPDSEQPVELLHESLDHF